MTLVLSFYCDGPKWDNLVHLPAYPSGCSYFRSFRYRDKWVSQALRRKAAAEPGSLDGRPLLIGARFRTAPWEWALLPIRAGRLDRFSFNEGEDHDIYFSVGRMYDFTDRTELSAYALEIPEGERTTVGDAFMFESSLIPPTELSVAKERASWAAFADALKATMLPVPEEVRASVFVRIQHPIRGKRVLTAKRVEKTESAGEINGFRLAEGARYEIGFVHRYPAFIDTDERMPPFEIQPEAPSGVAVTPRMEEVSGNYQTHFLRISGDQRADISSQLVLQPTMQANGPQNAFIPKVAIPVRVKLGWWYRIRTRWFWFFVMLAGLIASNYVILSTNRDIEGGDVVRLTVSAAIAAAAIFFSQQRSSK